MKYFKDCTTLDEIRSAYKKLALANHPDRGGDTALMQEINAEYAYACANMLNSSGWSSEKQEQEMEFSQEYREAIERIMHLPDILIELCGHWIWVTGNTKPVKDVLHEAGFRFAHKKVAWYYRSDLFKMSRGGRKTLEEIRRKYGSKSFGQNEDHAFRQIR